MIENIRFIIRKLAADRTAGIGALIIMLLIVVAIAAPSCRPTRRM